MGPRREERMKQRSCSPNLGLEWRKFPTRGGVPLEPPTTPRIVGSRPNSKQLVYIALSSSISLSFSLSIVITKPVCERERDLFLFLCVCCSGLCFYLFNFFYFFIFKFGFIFETKVLGEIYNCGSGSGNLNGQG